MAVKTTKQQFNQDCTFLGKVDFDQDVVLGRNGEVDGDLKINGKIINNGLGGKIYSHTIRINTGNRIITTTIILSTNTPIDSVTDLFTYLGNRDIAFSGDFSGDGSMRSCAYVHIGTSSGKTYFYDTSMVSYPYPGEVAIESVEDSVYIL